MPSTPHEVPILVLRDHPDLLLGFLGHALCATPTAYDRTEDKSNDLTQALPVSLRADLVLVFYLRDQPVLVLVLEVQRSADADKLRAWPAYLGELVYRYGCPCYLVVIAPDPAVAAWASQPNPFFQPSSPLLPLVLSSDDIPAVTAEQARHSPDLALLSLSVHGAGARSAQVVDAVMQVAHTYGAEYKIMVIALLLQLLDPKERKALEARIGMDLTDWYRNNENEAIRQSYQRGEIKGKAEDVLRIFGVRGLVPSPRQEEVIRDCKDVHRLSLWLCRAVTAASVAEVLDDTSA